MPSLPVVAGTLQTDPRSGGIKRSSGVNVLNSVAEAWAEVRDDSNSSVDWIIVGYDGSSKTDITVIAKGNGGVSACSSSLPEARAVFGGCRLENGRFVSFFYADENTPTMQKGRASMHKNGVLNVLEGCDGEIEIEITPDHSIEKMANYSTVSPPVPRDALSATEGGVSHVELSAKATVPGGACAEVTLTNRSIVAYEKLKDVVDASDLPSGVDPLNREKALSDDEFVALFGMDKESFQSLPGWKRAKMKKDYGLF